MRDDVATDWLCAVFREAHSVWVCNDLVGQDHGDSEFLCHPRKLPQKPIPAANDNP